MAEPRVLVMGDQVTFSFESRHVFSNASWVVREGERVALVAPNGAGKTTLIKLVLGKLQPDTGEVEIAQDLKYGYMTQQFEFPPETTVGQLVTELPPQAQSMKEHIERIESLMADPKFYEEPGYEDVITRYSEMQREFQQLASKGDENAALAFLQELGLPEATLDTKMRTLSGGQKTRVLLAKALANYQDMDLLILDEPTNHLDIETVEWLEEFLVERYGGALLLVAHDQYLMDNLATKVLEIDDRKVWEWDGNFTAFTEQKEATVRALEARRRRENDEFKRQLSIIEEIKRRNRFDHQAASKATRLEKMKRDSVAANGPNRSRQDTFKLVLKSVQKSSNDVFFADHVTKKFDGDTILDQASFSLSKGDKVGLIGPNGCGKTTLLRMIVGLEKPTSGTIEVAGGVKVGFFDQEHAGLDPTRTLIEEVRSLKRMGEEEARGLLGRFMFKGDEAFKRVDKLSGGEKARIALLKFILGDTNFLVLDEPTNHLDIASQRVVEDALKTYTGTLLVVSHDRHFLDSVVNKVAVVANRKIGIFPGTFSETRTLTRLHEFMGSDEPVPHFVRKSFKDYDSGRKYTTGESVLVTGGETQTTKRLFRLAIERGWLEPRV